MPDKFVLREDIARRLIAIGILTPDELLEIGKEAEDNDVWRLIAEELERRQKEQKEQP